MEQCGITCLPVFILEAYIKYSITKLCKAYVATLEQHVTTLPYLSDEQCTFYEICNILYNGLRHRSGPSSLSASGPTAPGSYLSWVQYHPCPSSKCKRSANGFSPQTHSHIHTPSKATIMSFARLKTEPFTTHTEQNLCKKCVTALITQIARIHSFEAKFWSQ